MSDYCVYLTVYSGNKLPPFYIGSTSVKRITNENYRGTVVSRKFKKDWVWCNKFESHLFKTKIFKLFNDREEANNYEEKIQRRLNVVRNPLYINMAYANRGFIHQQKHDTKTLQKISINRKNKGCFPRSQETRDKQSVASKGISKSEAHRQSMMIAKTGVKQSKETIEKRVSKFRGMKRTDEVRKKISDVLKNPSEEIRKTMSVAQRIRHGNTVVTLINPEGKTFTCNSLLDICAQNNLPHCMMLRSLKSGEAVKGGRAKGWQLISIVK